MLSVSEWLAAGGIDLLPTYQVGTAGIGCECSGLGMFGMANIFMYSHYTNPHQAGHEFRRIRSNHGEVSV